MSVPATVEKMEQELVSLRAAGRRIKELERENAKFRNELVELDHCRDLASKAEQYEKERDAALKDAERYRWLRALSAEEWDSLFGKMARDCQKDDFDAAIDAAIAAREG